MLDNEGDAPVAAARRLHPAAEPAADAAAADAVADEAPPASPGPTVRKIDGPANEPIELSGLAGTAVLKRALPASSGSSCCCSSCVASAVADHAVRAVRRPTARPSHASTTTPACTRCSAGGRRARTRWWCATPDGDPVVLRNAPILDDGTPMPTRYWLVGPAEVVAVSRLESTGAVRRAEAEIDPDGGRRRAPPLRPRTRRGDAGRSHRPTPERRRGRHAHRREVPARALRLVPGRRRRRRRRLGGRTSWPHRRQDRSRTR